MAADLIVCGARDGSFMRHLLLGSTAERMLNKTKCPMLVVKQTAHGPWTKPLRGSGATIHELRLIITEVETQVLFP